MKAADFHSLAAYGDFCQRRANEDFAGLSAAQVAAAADAYNAYPNLASLEPPRSLKIIEDLEPERFRAQALATVLAGGVFWEHTAAGEATRLGLGPKFLIEPWRLEGAEDLSPLSLGLRHLGQWAFELARLAEAAGEEPAAVLKRQKLLLIVSEGAASEISSQIIRSSFFGLKPENFYFMAQASFFGLRPSAQGLWAFDPTTPKRLHNHGQMLMQKSMDGQIFQLAAKKASYLSGRDYLELLSAADLLVSYNIEDLNYLAQALELEYLGLALELGRQGYGMSMEIMANNPQRPIKGGLCAHDPVLGRDVVVESFRLRDFPLERIKFLNKNFNHYPQPAYALKALKREGLFMPVKVEDEALYFQPVQGDLNFLVKTAYLSRRQPAVISAWKSPADTPAALEACRRQDAQPGFVNFMAATVNG